ncbi:hypothetical protein D3C76_1333640 [compost metagenome]
MKAGLAPVVRCIQWFEAGEGTGGLTHIGRLGSRDTGKACVAKADTAPHMQAQRWGFGELDGRVPKTHIAWDRQARAGFGQACGVQAVLFQQCRRVLAPVAHSLGQAMDKAHRQVAQTHPWLVHDL